MEKLIKNQKYDVEITDTNNLGYGVCKINGCAVFVKNCVQGDKCTVKIIKVLKNYAIGVCDELKEASAFRTSPECEYKRCGGCVFQHISFEYENELKKRYIESALKKAGLSDITVEDTLYADNKTSHYRNKAQYPLTKDKDGNIKAGFFAQKTHEVIPCDDCAISSRIFSDIVRTSVEFFQKNGFTVYDEKTGKGLLRHIYLRCAESTGQVMVCIVINGDTLPKKDEYISCLTDKFPSVRTVCININKENTNVILSKKTFVLYGDGYIEDTLMGKRFIISPASFYQVNKRCTEILYAKAKELLGNDYKCVLDLYCGIGTVGICIASDAEKLVGVEIVPEAIEDAKKNAKLNSLENCNFYNADASDIAKIAPDADCIIVDPPRKGITREVIDYIVKASPEKVVYISCDPDTLIRDIALFAPLGYVTDKITPVNMFPRTEHVETVILLSRKDVHERIKFDVNVEDLIK